MSMFSLECVMVMMMIMIITISLQMHGYRSCIETERKGLLELKVYGKFELPYDWPNDTASDCCRWERVECDLISGRVIGLFLNFTFNVPSSLNLSLLYPFGELRILNLSNFWCTEWFDDIYGISFILIFIIFFKNDYAYRQGQNTDISLAFYVYFVGYKSLGRLKKLEFLDFSYNGVNDSVLPFLSSSTSLKTLILRGNFIESAFPIEGTFTIFHIKFALIDYMKECLYVISYNLFSHTRWCNSNILNANLAIDFFL